MARLAAAAPPLTGGSGEHHHGLAAEGDQLAGRAPQRSGSVAIAVAGVFDVDVVLAPVERSQVLQRLDELDGPGQGAARRGLFQVWQQRRWPGVDQGEDMRLGQWLLFHIPRNRTQPPMSRDLLPVNGRPPTLQRIAK